MNLTARETEILKILEQNPMISQEELAKQLKISRSAVAVHISNLIKKGKIIGRGYVLSQAKKIVVVGRIVASMVQEHEQINFQLEGLGYYVSRGLAEMGEKVTVISAVGDDILGQAILNRLHMTAIDKQHLLTISNLPTAMEIQAGNSRFNSPGALQKISPDTILAKEFLFHNCFLAVNDCSLGLEQSLAVANLCRKHQVICVNYLGDVAEITPFFSSDCLVKLEIMILRKKQLLQLGINALDYEELINLNLFSLSSHGKIIIMCEKEGILIVSKNDSRQISLLPGQKLSNSFLVGFIYGLINGYNYSQAARIGLGNFQTP